jgi:hypothetical protein
MQERVEALNCSEVQSKYGGGVQHQYHPGTGFTGLKEFGKLDSFIPRKVKRL